MSAQEWKDWTTHVQVVADQLMALSRGQIVDVSELKPAPSGAVPAELVPEVSSAQSRLAAGVAAAEKRLASLRSSDRFVRQLPDASPASPTRSL